MNDNLTSPGVDPTETSQGLPDVPEIIYGRVYWYAPRPTPEDLHCQECGFLYALDESIDQDGRGEHDGVPVLILHPTRPGASMCPECGAKGDGLGQGWFRAYNLVGGGSLFGGRFADVEGKWLKEATPFEVAAFYLADEDAVDLGYYNGLRGFMQSKGGGSLRAKPNRHFQVQKRLPEGRRRRE